MAEPPIDLPLRRYTSFVADTLAKRIPIIVKGAEEGRGIEAVRQLKALVRAIEADGPMVLDVKDWPFPGWEDMPVRVNGKRPRSAPFFDFEYWMYFRILKAVKFPESAVDPFRQTKHKDLDKHLKWADEQLPKVKTVVDGLKLSLDANAHDLSQIVKPGRSYAVGHKLLEIDATTLRRINIICDNFGGEFVGDLILAIIAAEQGIETVLHVKQVPMFVSDVTIEDVTLLLDRLGQKSDFGTRLSAAVRVGTIRFAHHPFWSAPQFMDKLPVDELGAGEGVLNVLKGDLNYRRAIGDVSVEVGTPFDRLAVLPAASLLSLRSIKSYCVAGMTEWPAGVSRNDFPMEGSIVAVQRIPTRNSPPSARPVDETAAIPPLQRVRQWLRRGTPS